MKKIILLASVSFLLSGCGQTDLEACYERVEKIANNHPMGPEMGKIGVEIAKKECENKYGSNNNKTKDKPFEISPEKEKIINKPKISKDGYSKQGEDVFYKGKKISGAFASSFEDLGNNYGKDENFFYFCGKRMKQEPKFIDFKTLEFPEAWEGYGKDSKALYYKSGNCKQPEILEVLMTNTYDEEKKENIWGKGDSYTLVYQWGKCKPSIYKKGEIKDYTSWTQRYKNEDKYGYPNRLYYSSKYNIDEEKKNGGGNSCKENVVYSINIGLGEKNDESKMKYKYVYRDGSSDDGSFLRKYKEYNYLGDGYMKSSSTIYKNGKSLWNSLSKAPSKEELDSFTVLKDGMAKSKNALWENGKVIKNLEKN